MRIHNRTNRNSTKIVDKVALAAGIGGVLIYIPQIIKIWVENNVSGLSLITWTGFVIGACIWLVYGLVHKQRIIILTNMMLIVIQLIVVIGIIVKS